MIEHKELDLRHFYNLSDDTGVFSRAILNLPDRSGGYLTRDNASALAFAIRYYELTKDSEIQSFISLYLSFVYQAFNPATRRFKTLLLSSHDWVDEGLDIDQGLAIWALGLGARFAPEPESFLCASLVNQSIGVLSHCADANTVAATLIGLSHYSKGRSLDTELSDMMRLWFGQLVRQQSDSVKVYWALIQSADALGYKDEFYTAVMRFKVWVEAHVKDGVFNFEDASPETISLLVGASVCAFRNTKDVFWKDTARHAYNWFLGSNKWKVSLIDPHTGGCFQGFDMDGTLIRNQVGATSLSWLHSLCDLQDLMSNNTPFLIPQIKASVT
jgi:hypothetical protein